jgi:2-keto-4-pentenoate hydratase
MRGIGVATALLVTLVSADAAAAFDCTATAARLADAWEKRVAAASPGADLTRDQGACVQDALIKALIRQAGKPIGYKVALTSKATQDLFKVDSPVAGVLLADMLRPGGSTLTAAYGARPVFEADLLVRVKDAGVNQARTPLEVATHLSEVIPFIELPDLMVTKGEPMSGPVLVAINAGARLGVTGKPIKMHARAPFVDALAKMTVVTTDETGAELGRASGTAILGHPLNAVSWLARDLASHGKALKAGDLISLGSFGSPRAATPGHTITVRYDGLPGADPVWVKFE